MRTARTVCIVAAALALAPVASLHAATFCVNTVTELRDALTTAGANGENDTIRIKAGTYTPSDGGNAFSYSTSQNFDLTLEGGWITFIADCGLRLEDATGTVLSGADTRRVLGMLGSSGTSGTMTVRNLTLRDGFADTGAGLDIGGPAGFVGNLVIDRVILRNNLAMSFGGGLRATADGGTLTLTNSLFLGNRCDSNHCAASLTVNAASSATVRAFVGGNTIVANSCSSIAPPTCETAGVRIGGDASAAIYNNAFAFNVEADLRIQSPGLGLFNNNVEVVIGTPGTSSGNLALSDPLFVNPPGGDYRLQFTSPLRNAGTAGYPTGSLDLDGAPRLNEVQYDIGAYENCEVVFSDGFEIVL
jgi:hypothetical protein